MPRLKFVIDSHPATISIWQWSNGSFLFEKSALIFSSSSTLAFFGIVFLGLFWIHIQLSLFSLCPEDTYSESGSFHSKFRAIERKLWISRCSSYWMMWHVQSSAIEERYAREGFRFFMCCVLLFIGHIFPFCIYEAFWGLQIGYSWFFRYFQSDILFRWNGQKVNIRQKITFTTVCEKYTALVHVKDPSLIIDRKDKYLL